MGKVDSDNEDLPVFKSPTKQSKFPENENSETVFYPKSEITENAYVKSLSEYKRLYKMSIEKPSKFWGKMAQEFCFIPPQQKEVENSELFHYNFDKKRGPVYTSFMKGWKTNICYNVLDRHIINGLGDKTAFYWEGNEPGTDEKLTYLELHEKVCKFANALKSLGVTSGDVVAIYMPMVLETIVSMLACVRIGAVHSVVFAGYSAQSLADRLVDGKVKVLVTADGGWRGEKFMALKEISDEAINMAEKQGHNVPHCVVLNHLQRSLSVNNSSVSDGESVAKKVSYTTPYTSSRDKLWIDICENMSESCPPVWVDAEHPMFILYTSGSTGKPKGVVHSTAGYLVFASTVFKYSFDYHPERDVFWCTSDMGWCAAHTNLLYGPLSLGGTSVLFEGTPFYPNISRSWSIIDKYNVTSFYTAPTVLRHLMKFGDEPVLKFKRDSLRILGTVGEPINPQVWLWYHTVVGQSRCAIVDTYGQTETGGHLLTSLPGAIPTKPGAVGLPFFGSVPVLLTKEGKVIHGAGEGCLAFSQPWPCIVRTVFGDADRYEDNYFSKFPGFYCTGDAARRDEDGFYWITGRVDDMLNVSGHLISTTRVESALLDHKGISEVAVVPVPHEIKGQSLHAFVILKESCKSQNIVQELRNKVREKVGSFACPDVIIVTSVLPMTRSGKILRRVLVPIAMKSSSFGDTSTLIDDSVLNVLQDVK